MDKNDVIVTEDETVIVKAKLSFRGPYIYYFPEDRENSRKEEFESAVNKSKKFLFSIDFLLTKYNELMNK
jgi:hypothetical protein